MYNKSLHSQNKDTGKENYFGNRNLFLNHFIRNKQDPLYAFLYIMFLDTYLYGTCNYIIIIIMVYSFRIFQSFSFTVNIRPMQKDSICWVCKSEWARSFKTIHSLVEELQWDVCHLKHTENKIGPYSCSAHFLQTPRRTSIHDWEIASYFFLFF